MTGRRTGSPPPALLRDWTSALGRALVFAGVNTLFILLVVRLLEGTGAPLAPLWTQLVGWPLAWLIRSTPVQRALGGPRLDERLFLRLVVANVVFAATLAPTGLLFLFPLASVLVVTEHIHSQGPAAVRPGVLTLVVLTALLQGGAHVGAWPSALPLALGDVGIAMTTAMSVITILNLARLSAGRESERRARHAELEHAATHDGLTGLLNRAGLYRSLEGILPTAGAQRAVAVLYLDLNGFKPVNDRYGHATGDELLRLAAGRLGSVLRPGTQVARLGGDEFVAVLTGLEDPGSGTVEDIASRAAEALEQPFHLGHETICISASIGTAVTREPSTSADTLLQHADAAMYLAKQAAAVSAPARARTRPSPSPRPSATPSPPGAGPPRER